MSQTKSGRLDHDSLEKARKPRKETSPFAPFASFARFMVQTLYLSGKRPMQQDLEEDPIRVTAGPRRKAVAQIGLN